MEKVTLDIYNIDIYNIRVTRENSKDSKVNIAFKRRK